MIGRRAIFLDSAHRTPGLGYKNGSVALPPYTNTMPLYYLFGLDEIELSSFGEEMFLAALRLFVAALLGALISSSILLLILIRNDRARDNTLLGVVTRDAGEDGARGGPPPRLILCRFALAE